MPADHLRRFVWSGVAAAAISACAAPVSSRPAQDRSYALPAQPLGASLRAVAVASGRNVVAPGELVEGMSAPPLVGRFSTEAALAFLLKGSGLTARTSGESFVIAAEETRQEAADGNDIVVTGTRLRGAPIASPVIALSEDQIRSEGRATLAEAVRTIPQNFGGGQNPGVGNNVPATSGVNVGSATSVNLRGIGSDATLTLVNGHRLSYSASRQAVDISAIPLGAVERIEVVPDGASALYGSDAVAGVVNVILKRDFDGFEASARTGSSTDGGGFEQRYGAVGGLRWGSGGLVAAWEFGRTEAIEGRDRSYTKDRPDLTLFPFLRNHSATLSGHQDLAAGLQFEVDALYNNRFSDSSSPSTQGDVSLGGARLLYTAKSFVIAPTLRFDTGSGWRLFLTGSYGQDHTRYTVINFSGGTRLDLTGNCYCNNASAAELGGDGTLFRLPAGPVRVALGAGYRNNDFERFNGPQARTNVKARQDSYYAYGEVSLPLIGEEQEVPLARSLRLSGALRYERYPGVGEVVTPKTGIIYAPSPGLDLKASWGKSFRAPTLNQQFASRAAVLAPPFVFGGSGFPATGTALVLQGGNPDLKPERATSWSATLDLHPRFAQGARLELSWFRTRYRDRIVTPIGFLSQSLSNPIYADLVTLNPTAPLLDEVIESAISFINVTGRPYNPADVVALIDNSNVNAGFQKIQGADLLFSHSIRLPNDSGILGLRLNGTYLDSEQQLAPGQPVRQLAGILFNPPHVQARAGLSWARGAVIATGNLTYIGGVEDSRLEPAVRVGSMTTTDLTLRYRSPDERGPLSGFQASFSVQNLFNVKPDLIATTLFTDAPYDSTNYSPLGRFVALAVSKRW